MAWITPITDRTQADVDYVNTVQAMFECVQVVTGIQVKDLGNGYYIQFTGTQDQLNEWNSGLKGAYNASDLNRVGGNIYYLATQLNAMGYDISVAPKINWTYTDAPTQAQVQALLADLRTIKQTLAVSNAPVPQNMNNMTVDMANNIEKILQDTYDALDYIAQSFFYSGELYAGGH